MKSGVKSISGGGAEMPEGSKKILLAVLEQAVFGIWITLFQWLQQFIWSVRLLRSLKK